MSTFSIIFFSRFFSSSVVVLKRLLEWFSAHRIGTIDHGEEQFLSSGITKEESRELDLYAKIQDLWRFMVISVLINCSVRAKFR